MSFIAPLSQAIGTGLQAYGSYKAGKDEQKAYDVQAQLVLQEASLKKEEIAASEEALAGEQRQAYAKAGVKLSGSALDVMLDSATQYEFDKLVVDYNARVKSQILEYQGKVAKNAGLFKAGQTLFGFAQKIPLYTGGRSGGTPSSGVSSPSSTSTGSDLFS